MRIYTGKCVICGEENSLNFLFDRRFARCTYCELPYYRVKESEPWQHSVPEVPDRLEELLKRAYHDGYGVSRFQEWLEAHKTEPDVNLYRIQQGVEE